MKKYVLFTKPSCPFCVDAVSLLEEKGETMKVVSFKEDQEDVLSEVKSAYDWPTVPMVFTVDGANISFIGGYTDLVRHLDETT